MYYYSRKGEVSEEKSDKHEFKIWWKIWKDLFLSILSGNGTGKTIYPLAPEHSTVTCMIYRGSVVFGRKINEYGKNISYYVHI